MSGNLPDTPAIEGTVIERNGNTVRDVMEQLSKLDPNLVVVTNDNEFGFEYPVMASEFVLETWSLSKWQFDELCLKPGDTIVVIQNRIVF